MNCVYLVHPAKCAVCFSKAIVQVGPWNLCPLCVRDLKDTLAVVGPNIDGHIGNGYLDDVRDAKRTVVDYVESKRR